MTPNIISEQIQSIAPRLTVRRNETVELRKTMKPLMEKRRRARINESLNHLKTLIIPLTCKDKPRHSKFEKADILEMAVRFLGDTPAALTNDSYKEGYKTCLQRVSALLPKTNVDKDACQRVNEFIQQSMSAYVTPACQNCCAQSSRAFPQIQQRLIKIKASLSSRVKPHSSGPLPNRPRPVSQAVNDNMWRPW